MQKTAIHLRLILCFLALGAFSQLSLADPHYSWSYRLGFDEAGAYGVKASADVSSEFMHDRYGIIAVSGEFGLFCYFGQQNLDAVFITSSELPEGTRVWIGNENESIELENTTQYFTNEGFVEGWSVRIKNGDERNRLVELLSSGSEGSIHFIDSQGYEVLYALMGLEGSRITLEAINSHCR